MDYKTAIDCLTVPYYYPSLPPVKVDDPKIFDDSSKCLNNDIRIIIHSLLKLIDMMCDMEERVYQAKNSVYILRCKEFGPALKHMSKSYDQGWNSWSAEDYKPMYFANTCMAPGRYVEEMCFKIQKTLTAIAVVGGHLQTTANAITNVVETNSTKAAINFATSVLAKTMPVDLYYNKPNLKSPDSTTIYDSFCDYELYRLLGHIYGALTLYVSGLIKCITGQSAMVDSSESEMRLQLMRQKPSEWFSFNSFIDLYYQMFTKA
nr:ORF1 [Acipenserid herpesvirus 1]